MPDNTNNKPVGISPTIKGTAGVAGTNKTPLKINSKYIKPAADFVQNEIQKRNLTPNASELVKYYASKNKAQINLDAYGQPGEPDEPWDYRAANDTEEKLGPNGEKLPEGAVGWTANQDPWYGTNNSFTEWMKGFKNNLFKDTRDEEDKFRVGKFAGNLALQALYGAGAAFEYGEKIIEQKSAGGLQYLEALADEGDRPGIAGIIPDDQSQAKTKTWLQEYANKNTRPQWLDDATNTLVNVFNMVDVIDWGWDAYRAVEVINSGKDTSDIKYQDYTGEAGKIAYSNWLNPAIREEYNRRLQNGENPYLLQVELANPTAELVGSLLVDPTIIWGAFFKAKDAKNIIKTAAELATKPAGEFKIFKNFDEIADASKMDEVVGAAQKFINRIGTKLDDQSNANKLWSLTSEGKRNFITQNAGQVGGFILDATRHKDGTLNPDKAMEVMDFMLKLTSDNADEVAEAVRGLGALHKQGVPLGPLFSEAGGYFAHIMRKTADAGGGIDKFADTIKATETIEDAIKLVDEATELASKKIFPSIAEKAKAIEKAREAGKAFTELSLSEQSLLRIENLANSKGLTGLNSFFAHIYMGMSPGYAARNIITNTLHILVDEGASALFPSINSQTDFIKDVYGYVISAAKKGIGSAGIEKSESLFGKLTGWGLKAGQWGEQRASVRLVAASTKRVMNSMLKPGRAIPDIAPLLDEGWDLATAKHLQNLLLKTNGNVSKAEKLFRKELDSGINLFKALGWLDDGETKLLNDFDKMGMFRKIVDDAEDVDGYVDEVSKMIDDMIEEATERVSREMPDIEPGTDLADEMEAIAQSGQFSDEEMHLMGSQKLANRLSDDKFADALDTMRTLAQKHNINLDEIIAKNPELEGVLDIRRLQKQLLEDFRVTYKEKAWDWTNLANANNIRDYKTAWKSFGLSKDIPEKVTKEIFLSEVWEKWYHPTRRKIFRNSREQWAEMVGTLFNKAFKDIDDDFSFMDDAVEALEHARKMENAKLVKLSKVSTPPQTIRRYMRNYNVDNMTQLRNIVNKFLRGEYTDEVVENARQIDDVLKEKPGVIREALRARLLHGDAPIPETMTLDDYYRILDESENVSVFAIEEAADVGKATTVAAPYAGNIAPSSARGVYQNAEKLENLKKILINKGRENWGQIGAAVQGQEDALKEWLLEASRREKSWKFTAQQVATKSRDFALHDYSSRRNFDTVLGLIYPYQYWYSRTYPKWMLRIAKNPKILSDYYNYRTFLEGIHSDQPEWWKYNINTNELLGLDSENPLFFNLEATLNPMNGLTGVDFEDKYKRVNWLTRTVDDMNKLGPSTHTAISWVLALSLYMNGDKDAAARWAGRLGSAPAAATSIKALLGGSGVDLDPVVRIFSGDTDPYTEKAANRALAAMQEDGIITAEQALDAARSHSGAIWQQALQRVVKERAPGKLSSFLLGAGFKPRSKTDLETDKMYNEYFALFNGRSNMTPAEFKEQMLNLNIRYPFMDTVLVGMKNEDKRDTAYSWSVLSRIPPGDSHQIYEMVGLDSKIVDRFYKDKGDFKDWPESDRSRFISAIVDIATVLAVPPNTTKQEWGQAKLQYGQVEDALKSMFGESIQEKIDVYWDIYNSDGDQQAKAYLAAYPLVEQAMDFRTNAIVNGPRELQAYYSGLNKIQSYYKGILYGNAERMFGKEIFKLNEAYWVLDKNEQKAFLKEHPELKEYWEYKNSMNPLINERIINMTTMLPEGQPAALRQDYNELQSGVGAQNLFQQIQQPQDPYLTYSPTQWQSIIGSEAYLLALQATQRELEYSETKILDKAADNLDLYRDRLIQYVGISVQNTNNMLQNVP